MSQRKFVHEFSLIYRMEGAVNDLRPGEETLWIKFSQSFNTTSVTRGLPLTLVMEEAENAALEFAAQFLGVETKALAIAHNHGDGWDSIYVKSADGGKLPEPIQMEMDISGFI